MKPYKAKSGKTQYMPSVEEAIAGDAESQGFCLACGETQDGVEPDGSQYKCDCCGALKVFGFAELALRGLTHD